MSPEAGALLCQVPGWRQSASSDRTRFITTVTTPPGLSEVPRIGAPGSTTRQRGPSGEYLILATWSRSIEFLGESPEPNFDRWAESIEFMFDRAGRLP